MGRPYLSFLGLWNGTVLAMGFFVLEIAGAAKTGSSGVDTAMRASTDVLNLKKVDSGMGALGFLFPYSIRF